MSKIIKCPICDKETEHYKVQTLCDGLSKEQDEADVFSLIEYKISLWGDVTARFGFDDYFHAYVCEECGHVELFAKELVYGLKNRMNEYKENKESIEQEIKTTKDSIRSNMVKQKEHENRILDLKELLRSEDITIKKQKAYKEEKSKIEKELMIIEKELSEQPNRLTKLENELGRIDYKMKRLEGDK